MAVNTIESITPAKSVPEEGKTPSTRLLDMMAGWSRYAQNDTENGTLDFPGTDDKIEDLYQQAALLEVGKDSPNDPETQKAIYDFLVTGVMPLLMGR